MDELDIGKEAWEMVKGIFAQPANLGVLIVTWGVVEYIPSPILRWLIASPRFDEPARVRWASLIAALKQPVVMSLCLALTWAPLGQPALCIDADTEACQTIIERLTVATVLGMGLILGHAKIRGWFKARGAKKNGKPEVTIS